MTGESVIRAAVVLMACLACASKSTPPPSPSPASAAAGSATAPDSGAAAPMITLPNGLQMQDIVIGTGEAASARRQVTVHYVGMLANGQIFEDSHTRTTPFTFVLGTGRVLKGWDQGIKGMRVGGRRKLIIPPGLAYGPQGQEPIIPPNATLVFEIELLDVK